MKSLKYLRLIVLLGLCCPCLSVYSSDHTILNNSPDPEIQEFIGLVNAKRGSFGCPELQWDDRIASVAQDHSRDMVVRNFFSHTNPDGKNPNDRVRESDLCYSIVAENIAKGPKTGRDVYELWLHSPGHRRNMLDCRFTKHGIGKAGDRWTHDLLKP
jgi:uncharacterized protein YkwD